MEAVVFIGGSIKEGFSSPTSGESRWAQNLAKMLAERGHNVDVVANAVWDPPSWGATTPLSNVRLLSLIDSEKEYDIAIYVPWEYQVYENNQYTPWRPCHEVPLKAKWYIHCTFSWTHSLVDKRCWQDNHILAYPYIQEDNQFKSNVDINPFKTFPLPYPIFDSFDDVDLENKKDILWACKDVFHPGWEGKGEHVPRIGMDILHNIKKLSEEFDFNFNVLSIRFFDPKLSSIAAKHKPLEFIKTIPNTTLHELIPKNKLLDILRRSRLNVIVSGLFGSFGESITTGCAPLCYRGHIYRAAAEECDIKLDDVGVSREELFEVMYKLYTDDDFYMKYILACRREMRYYSFDESYKYFVKMSEELGLDI